MSPTDPQRAQSENPAPRAEAIKSASTASQRNTLRPSLLWKIGRLILRVATARYFDLKVYGTRHIPRSGGVLIVSNHQSYLDPVLVGVQILRPMSYLAKAQLFENVFFSWLIRSLNAFPVRQGEGDVGAVKETIRRLGEGHMLTIFAEGSRTPDGNLLPVQPGVGLVVRRADVPVIPAIIDGSFQAWPRKQRLPRAHPIRVVFGKPLELQGLKGAQVVKLIDSTLHQMLADLRAGNVSKYR